MHTAEIFLQLEERAQLEANSLANGSDQAVFDFLSVKREDGRPAAIPSPQFPSLSAPGPTGERPEHLRDCLANHAVSGRRRLLRAPGGAPPSTCSTSRPRETRTEPGSPRRRHPPRRSRPPQSARPGAVIIADDCTRKWFAVLESWAKLTRPQPKQNYVEAGRSDLPWHVLPPRIFYNSTGWCAGRVVRPSRKNASAA